MNYQSRGALNATALSSSGLVPAVVLLECGEAKGHGVIIDQTTLQNALELARAAGKLRCKFNPQTFDHGTGCIAGYFDNFRVNGTKLIADLHLASSCPSFDYISELVASMPEAFGLSITFNGWTQPVAGEQRQRITELYDATIVDTPAATSGVFGNELLSARGFSKGGLKKLPQVNFAALRQKPYEEILRELVSLGFSKKQAVIFSIKNFGAAYNAYMRRQMCSRKGA